MISFPSELTEITLEKRIKRFIVETRKINGEKLTVHCANSGSMKTCFEAGWKGYISDSGNPARKYRHTLELTDNGKGLIGVNTGMANKVVLEAVRSGVIPELNGYDTCRGEVKFGEHTRFDAACYKNQKTCYIEVKTVSLCRDNIFSFPDAVTERGQKHLKELMLAAEQGSRAVMLFLLMRDDGEKFEPAGDIDPEYARLYREASCKGVEILVYRTIITMEGITIGKRLL